MKIMYLGTGAGMGMPGEFCGCVECSKARSDKAHLKENKHSRSQYLIGDKLLIDYPMDSYMHQLMYDLDFSSITDLLITHYHDDHFNMSALGSYCQPNWYDPKGIMTIHCSKFCEEKLLKAVYGGNKATMERARLYSHNPEFYKPFTAAGYEVIAVPAHHDAPETGSSLYIITDTDEDKTYFHFHDSGPLSDEVIGKMAECGRKFDLITFDCTACERSAVEDWGVPADQHMGLKDFAVQLEKLRKAGLLKKGVRYFASHIAHYSHACYDELKPYADEIGAEIAYDGLVVEI